MKMYWLVHKWEGNSKKERLYIYIYIQMIHFTKQQKIILHCKATIFQ